MFENFGFLRNNYSYCEKFAVNRKVAFFTTTDRALRFFSGFFSAALVVHLTVRITSFFTSMHYQLILPCLLHSEDFSVSGHEQMAFQQTFKQFHQFYFSLADRHSQNLKESNNLKALGAS